jgi:hypothetical protein
LNFAHFVVSEQTEFGERLLQDFGALNVEARASAGGSYPHMFMTACVTASFEIAAKKRSLRFISKGEILAASPTKTLSLPAPISYTFADKHTATHKKPVTADAMFGLEYPTGRSYFLVEVDLNNEPLRRNDFDATSYLRKILQYREAIGGGTYKTQFRIEQGLVVLNFTTNAKHAENIVGLIGEELGKCRYLLTTAAPEFDGPFSVPGVIEDIIERPYIRSGYTDFCLAKFV